MVQHFITVDKAAQVEIAIKKSKFICHINKVETVEEAQSFVDSIRKMHWDANHNVSAWRVGFSVPIERFSDDGELAGTAGMPVLEVLRKKNLTNCAVVVTRYFGGILLGAGGLVRAYTESTVQGLYKAGVATYYHYQRFSMTVPYALMGSVIHLLEEAGTRVEAPEFGSEVVIKGWVMPEAQSTVEKKIADLSQGQLHVEWGVEKYLPVT